MATFVAQEEQPISRTYQYRKVMKPMLERKRRARINRCLDELKELLVGALQAEGESVSRLEKADVLELTVRHLHKLRRSQQLNETGAHDRFKAGFIHCANEVSKYVTTLPSNVDISVSSRLLSHLDGCIRHIDQAPKSPNYPSNHSLLSPVSSSNGLNILTSYTPPASPISSPKNLNGNVVHGNGGGVSGVHPHHNIHGSSGGVSGSSHVNLLNLSHAKLFAYLPTPSSSADSMGSLSPVPAHHFSPVSSSVSGGGHFHPHPHSHAKPLALCTSNNNSNIGGGMTGIHKTHGMYHPMEDEPFDLSNNDNVWRPW